MKAPGHRSGAFCIWLRLSGCLHSARAAHLPVPRSAARMCPGLPANDLNRPISRRPQTKNADRRSAGVFENFVCLVKQEARGG